MCKVRIFCKSEKLIKTEFENMIYLLASIRDDLLNLFTVTSNIKICLTEDITRPTKYIPKLPIITHISSLFEKLSLRTYKRVFIWSIESSSRKREKRMISWGLLLLCHKNLTIRKYSYHEGTIEKLSSFETFYRAIIELLVPLIYIYPYSWEYLTSIFWYRIIHGSDKFMLSWYQVSYRVARLFHLHEIHEQSPIIFRLRYDRAFLSFSLQKTEQDYIRYRQVRS